MLRNYMRALAYVIVATCLTQCTAPSSTDTPAKASGSSDTIAPSPPEIPPTSTVWIDADLAVGMKRYGRPGYSDVDDGYAILQMLLSDKVEISGISTVYGNTKVDDAYRLAQLMVSDYSDRDILVSKGAAEAIDLAAVKTNDAVEAMAASLREAPQKILAIGPATNVGLLLLLYPDLADRIQEVVLVAGRRTAKDYFSVDSSTRRFKDLNFDLDNTAFEILLQSGIPVALCPFEISHKVWLREKDLDYLAQQSEGSQWLAEKSRPWLAQWGKMGADGFNPFDVLASHYLLHPEDIVSEHLNARLSIHPDDTAGDDQNEQFKNYLLCDDQPGYPIKYCYGIVDGYHDKLLATLAK